MKQSIDWDDMFFSFLGIAIVLASVWGWILNILKIIDFDESKGWIAARIIGAFIAPLGAVLGYF